jgi:hypothetical protein
MEMVAHETIGLHLAVAAPIERIPLSPKQALPFHKSDLRDVPGLTVENWASPSLA